MLVVLSTLAVSLNACGGSLWWGTQDNIAPVSFQVYLRRGGGSTEEFEQYKSVPSGVFVECGALVQGQAQPKEQGIAPVSVETEALIRERAHEVMESSDEHPEFSRDVSAGAEPIFLSLKVEERVVEIRTSFDLLVRSEAPGAVALRELLEVVRGIPSKALCGRAVFVQIARRIS